MTKLEGERAKPGDMRELEYRVEGGRQASNERKREHARGLRAFMCCASSSRAVCALLGKSILWARVPLSSTDVGYIHTSNRALSELDVCVP